MLTIAAVLIGSCGPKGDKKENDNPQDNNIEMTTEQMKKVEEPEFNIFTTHGTMRIRLYSKTPKHRDNFAKLVAENFYDSVRFHRVIEGFMIQCGDPFSRDTALIDKWGTGGPDYTVPAEFVEEYRHKKGAIAAARMGDLANPSRSSSGSQFYIVQDEEGCAHLDGQYTVFGEVVSGLEVIDRIASLRTDRYSRPYEDAIITAIKPVIQIAEKKETDEQSEKTDSTKAE